MTQIISSTTAGMTYQLTLWAEVSRSSENHLRITVNGVTLQFFQLTSANIYTQFVVAFTATGTSTTISILGHYPADYIYVDDVSLAACL